MSEFCPECFEKYNGFSCENYVISKDLDICEGCGELKQVVLCEKSFFAARLFDRSWLYGKNHGPKRKRFET